MIYNETVITEETIRKTRDYFIEIYNNCINRVEREGYYAGNITEYITKHKDSIKALKSGELDNSTTFLQRAYYIQTGKLPPLIKYS